MIPAPAIQKSLDVYAVRQQFPALSREVKGQPLVYFDNAATTQKPQVVIDALVNYYSNYNANIHRGIHTLAEEATAAYEATRDTVQQSSMLKQESRLFLPGVLQKALTWWHKPGAGKILKQGMRSLFPPWNTILILFPGIYCAKKKAQQ
jgi:hypothetical protein